MTTSEIIVIPIHHRGGKFRNNKELGYAIRSIRKNFQGAFQIVICSRTMPTGFEDCGHLYDGGKGLKTALAATAKAYPNGFFWWYDDCILLQPQNADQLKVTLASRKWSRASSSWAKKILMIKNRLEAEGYKAWDYSRPHGPYWFDKNMVDEGFRDWPGMASKFPWESWILSKRNWPRKHGNYRQYYGAFKSEPRPNEVLLNFNEKGFTVELIAWLEARFPDPKARPEKRGSRVLYTCHEGCDPRIWEWCGPGITAFSKERNAELVILPKCTDLNPQWVIFDAMRASLDHREGEEFAWIDSDIVVAHPATDFWSLYPNRLHLCVNGSDLPEKFKTGYGIPLNERNICTGIVKWNREEAAKLVAWYAVNKGRFARVHGDQELLVVALHELGMKPDWFHPAMHVAGSHPPAKTAFKHKGGKSKIKWIPRFLRTNMRRGLCRPEHVLQK
jgi:hypothetical protein